MFATTPTIGAINNFDHLQHDWKIYKSRLHQWFIANNLSEDTDKAGVKRKAVLLSALSESTYQLACNLALPNDLDTKNYESILKILDDHFTPRHCGFAERHKFYAAVQQTSETHSQWAARLRGLAAHCAFKDLEESLLDKLSWAFGKQRAWCRLHFRMIEKRRAAAGRDTLGVLIIDTVVSSDDSATYGSIVLPQGYTAETVKQADELLDMLLKLEVTHSRFFMMMESAKSCISSKHVGEFNSIFSCKRTYISPAIKKILAAATIPENEDLESRQVVLSNMYKDILEEGCSHYQVHLTELCNSFLHYTAFGLATSPLFPSWAALILNHPDPHLGFLLVDQQDCAGVFGFDFKKLLSLSNTNIPIMPSTPTVLQTDIEGDFNSGVVITQGDRRRWLQLVDRVATSGWEEYLEKNPHVLYMERGVTKEEISSRLSSKVCSKGVHDSLKEGNSMTRIIASTVYLLSRNVVCVKSLHVNDDGNVKEVSTQNEKRSLMSLTKMSSEKEHLITHEAMTNDQRALFYPNHLLHTGVSEALKATRDNQLVQSVLYRKTRNRIEVRGSSSVFILPILTVLRWAWLKGDVKYSRTVLDFSWRHYKTIFPWLRGTLEESLKEGPFTSHIRMFGFLQSVDKKGARLNILCKRLKSFSPYDQVIELSLHNQYPGMRRLPSKKEKFAKTNVEQPIAIAKTSVLSSLLASTLYAPIKGDIVKLIGEHMEEANLSLNELNTLSRTRTHGRLAAIYAAVTKQDAPVIESCLLNCNRGVVKAYKEPQEWTGRCWAGQGRLIVSTGRLTIEALVFDQQIIALKSKNIPILQSEYGVISEYLKADGFSWDLDKPVRSYIREFPELLGNLTDWTCSSKGLFRIPPTVTVSTSKRGIITTTKRDTNLLDHPYPVVIQDSDIASSTIDGEVIVEKSLSKTGQPVILLKSKQPNGGELILLKYYGPRHPKLCEDVREYFSDLADNDDFIGSWMLGVPLASKYALSLIKSVDDPLKLDSLIKGEIIDRSQISNFIRESFKWRCIAKTKVQLNSYRFVDDLENIEEERPQFNLNLQQKMDEIAGWFSEVVWGSEVAPDPTDNLRIDHRDDDEINPEPLDVIGSWAQEVGAQMEIEDLAKRSSPHYPTSPDPIGTPLQGGLSDDTKSDESQSCHTPTKIDCEVTTFRSNNFI